MTGDATQNFSLAPMFAEGCSIDYNEIEIFHDGFEAGSLGSDWSTYIVDTGRVRVADTYPYSGTYGVTLDYRSDWWGTSALILTQNLSAYDSVLLDFWWREFNDDNHAVDGVWIREDDESTWHQVFSFNDGPNTYRNDIIPISAWTGHLGFTTYDKIQIKFQGYDWDEIPDQGYALDEIKLVTCEIIDHGFLAGTVSDAYTSLPLAGATVSSDSGRETTADANGAYRMLDTPGVHTFTASDGGYQTISQTLTIIQNSTLNHDFSLPWLGATPAIMAVADIDGDGDLDVIGNTASRDAIYWWENASADGSTWVSHTVATGINNLVDVAVADIDRDGDMDVTAVSSSADSLFWWENANADGSSWVAYTMASNLDSAASVHAADIDRNGAIDLLVSAADDNDIIWYQNPLTVTREFGIDVSYITDTVYTPSLWISHTVVSNFSGASVATTVDFDDDGDLDILAGSTVSNTIIRLRNDGHGTSWYQYPTTWEVAGVTDIAAADLDGDGAADVIAAANSTDDILAWINGGDGSSWTAQTIESEFSSVIGVSSEDVDLDGDLDILAAGDDGTSWFENTIGNASAWTERIIDETVSYAVRAADLDNDDDYDFVGASFADDSVTDTVTWWENDTIHSNVRFTGAYHVIYDGDLDQELTGLVAGDIDGDGDQDFAASYYIDADWVRWWENDAGTWTMHTITTAYIDIYGLELGDIDNDGDLDAVGIATTYGGHSGTENEVLFWENVDGSGTTWSEHILPKDGWIDGQGSYDELESLTLADMNNDGQLDIVVASKAFVHWFERWTWQEYDDDGNGPYVEWKAHMIARQWNDNVLGTWMLDMIPTLDSGDMDGDGDTDLVVGAWLDYSDEDGIAFWYENTAPCNGAPGQLQTEYNPQVCRDWIRHELDRNLNVNQLINMWSNDVNRDGKQDVGTWYDWWENGGRCTQDNDDLPTYWKRCRANDQWPFSSAPGSGWWWPSATADVQFRRTVEYTSPPLSWYELVYVDLDNDGDLDRLMGGGDDGFFWLENVGGQFELPTTDTSPASMNAGTQDDVFQIELTHLGWSGDEDLAWTTIELLLEDVVGNDALTTAEANAIVANLHLYLDDGDGAFAIISDTLVHTEPDLSLAAGVHTITLTDDDPNLTLSQATGSQTYFLVVELDGELMRNPARNGVTDIRLTHQTESSSQAEQAGTDSLLNMAYTADTSAEIELLGATIDLIIGKDVSPTVASPGDTITYTLTYLNAGINTATGVVITDIVASDQFSVISAQSSGAVVTPTGVISYVWSVEDLAPDAGGAIILTGVLSDSLPAGTYSNETTIGAPGDVVTDNNSSSVDLLVYCPPSLVVDSLGDGDDGDYCSGSNTLREAIAHANAGDTVTFDAGLSGGAITLGGAQLELTRTLSIEAGVPITISGNNASRVFTITSNIAVTLTGLTIRDGRVDGDGGGVYSLGDLRLESTRLIRNTASTNGGGLYVRPGPDIMPSGESFIYFGSAVLIDTQLVSNKAEYGGGLLIDGGAPLTIDGGEVHDNSATQQGGGLYLASGSTTLSDAQVYSNSASSGGGVYIDNANVVLNSTSVTSNTVSSKGSGLYIGPGNATMIGGEVRENAASVDGGGFYINAGSVTLTGTQVISNSASNWGGGLYIHEGSAILSATQVISNSANHGGGLFVYDSSAVLNVYDGEVRGNTVPLQGGGMYLRRGTTVLSGTQVSGNSAGTGGGLYIQYNNTTLNSTQVLNNSVGSKGGGLYINTGATFNDVSVSGNSAKYGGGMYVSAGSTTLSGTSVDGSATQDGDAVYQAGGTLTSTSALTITGQVYQTGGAFAASSYDLNLDGDLELVGGDFFAPDAPSTFNLSGDLTHTGGNYHQTQDVTGNQDVGFPKTGGLILNANGLDLGSTVVTITAGIDCAGVTPGEAVQHCYLISPSQTTGRDATITFFYRDTELPANHNCSATEAFAWDGAWDNQLTRDTSYGSDGRLCSANPQSIQVKDVTNFPTFVLRGMFADLEINKTVTPTEAKPGDTITYTLSYSNAGVLAATNVVITDVIAVGNPATQFSSLDYQYTGATITETGTTSYTWQVADLAPGEGGAITITGELNDPLTLGTYTNSATISGEELEADTSNNTSSVDLLVYCQPGLVVDNLGDGDDGNYCAGKNTLREAIAHASAGDTVTFDAGLSGGAITLGGTQLELTQTLSIDANVPITVSGNNASRVFNISSGVAVTLTGLTIRDGNSADFGGGIYSAGDLRLESTDVISNSAQWGAGLYIDHSDALLTMIGGEVRENAASVDGGGFYINAGSVTLTGTQVISNSASNWGGGLYIHEGSAILSATQVISNSANHGGGLFVYDSSAVLNVYDGEVRGNTVPLQGGGMYLRRGTTVLSGTQVSGNSAGTGGGLYIRYNNTTLNSTQVYSNAANKGDAVYNYAGTITSTSALTLSGEVYQTGGAFAASSYDLNLDGDLVLAGGDFYAPDAPNTFTLSGDFTHSGGNYHQTQVVTGSLDIGFPKAGGLILNANNLNLDSTTVTLTAGEDCAGVTTGEAVQHCYVIAPTQTGGRDATLTLFYRDSELSTNHDCSVMEAYAWGGAWNNQLTRNTGYDSDGRLCGSEPQSIQVLGVSSFPTFTLRGNFVDLAISKTVTSTLSVAGEAAPGEIITYTLTFTNNGPVAVAGVVITDTLPDEITVQNITSSGDMAITHTLSTQTSEVFETSEVSPGQGGLITITAQVSSSLMTLPTTFTNTATITFSNAVAFLEESDTSNNSASVGLTVPQFGLDSVASDGLVDINSGDVAWGDYDNDGDLDILLTGQDDYDFPIIRYALVYENTGNASGIFTETYNLGSISGDSAAWGDYDNDGDLDILLSGWTGSKGFTKVYENTVNAGGGFAVAYTLTGVSGDADWGDYDNDGDLDILLTGYRGVNNYVTELYENVSISFTLAYTLTGVVDSDVDWGDYDNDGDLDILLTGETVDDEIIARVYENRMNAGGAFTVVFTPTGVYEGDVAWGDYDNDGYLDILLTGYADSGRIAEVYKNTGNHCCGSGFTLIESGLLGVDFSSVAWGDYDNDDDLDILLIGAWEDDWNEGLISAVYRNNNGTANSRPAAPSGLSAGVDGYQVDLSWTAATDPETMPNAGLTYNLYVGSAPGQSDILAPMAFTAGGNEGLRLLPDLGNAQHGLTATLTVSETGTYYWSVQAIDTAFAGSTWAAEASFEVEVVNLVIDKTVSPTSAMPGDPITYTITFSNAGSTLATGVVITDIVPVSVTATSVISSGVAITQTNVGVVTYTWEVQDLAADQGGVITITGQVSSSLSTGATFTNTATITTTSTESGSTNNSSTAAVFVADEVEQQCGVQVGNTYTFHYASTPVTITITTLGDIDCLTIARADSDHPDATAGIQTGAYWNISATNSSGAAASSYTVDLTITVSFVPDADDRLCRYTGSGWDCAADSFDAGGQTITRNGVTQFSDWAGGNDVGATAVTLPSFTARPASSRGTSLPLLALLALVAVGVVGLMLRVRRRR